MAMRRLPWKAALESSGKLVGRLERILVIGLRALECEVVALWSEMRELEREAGTLQKERRSHKK